MIEAPESVREATINYTMQYYEKNGKLPSISVLCDKKKGLEGLNRTKFYEAFPDGIRELGDFIGVEVPQERMDSTKKALEGKEKAYLKEDRMAEQDVNSIMRLLEAKTPKEAGKKAVSFISGMCSYSELKGLKDPVGAWEGMQSEIDEFLDRNIELSLALEEWQWHSDLELARLIGVHPEVMKIYQKKLGLRQFKEGDLIPFLNGAVITLYKQAIPTMKKHLSF